MRFVDEHRDRYAVALLLRVLASQPSTYYGWVQQAEQPCDRDQVDLGLLTNIHEIWTSVRLHLRRRTGCMAAAAPRRHPRRPQAGRAADARAGLAGRVPAPGLARRLHRRRTRRPRRRRTWSTGSSPPTAPNRLWVADATRIPCGEGVFWLAAVRDVFSNRIVGWKTARTAATPT